MRRVLSVAALTVLALATVPAGASVWGVPDVAPASTLLLPYFEVELDDPSGVTTLFSINNASSTPVLVHVVLWTDWSQHSLDFNVYLTGYDVQTINLRDVFEGDLPITASAGQDPGDLISPQGDFSYDFNFASCNDFFPFTNPALPEFNLRRIRLGHTGQPVPDLGADRCIGSDYGDSVARGYLTVDTVVACSTQFHDDAEYFGPAQGKGLVSYQNVLWGDFFIVDRENEFAFGDTLVHIESTQPPGLGILATVPNDTGYTFYSRYVGNSGLDAREPLGTIFATRFLNGGVFEGGTHLIVWRDSTADDQPATGFDCAVGPSWEPLSQREIVVFDEFENPVVAEGCTISPCPEEEGLIPFPLETQRTAVGGADLPVPFEYGWLYLDLHFPVDDTGVVGDVDPTDGRMTQSYVITNHDAKGFYQVGHPATTLRLATELPPFGCLAIPPDC
jgi:hypothetical protein